VTTPHDLWPPPCSNNRYQRSLSSPRRRPDTPLHTTIFDPSLSASISVDLPSDHQRPCNPSACQSHSRITGISRSRRNRPETPHDFPGFLVSRTYASQRRHFACTLRRHFQTCALLPGITVPTLPLFNYRCPLSSIVARFEAVALSREVVAFIGGAVCCHS
jgi:hypothetical protein